MSLDNPAEINSKSKYLQQRVYSNSNKHVRMAANSLQISNVSFSKVINPVCFNLIGRILKDDHNLDVYKIEDGVTVHLVKAKSATAESGAQPTPTATA